MPEETFRVRTFSNPEPVQHHELARGQRSPVGSPAVSITPSGRAIIDTEVTSTRPSRASSIVSTRTKVSINTLQEDARSARSIDLVIGNQSFRIARDGSRVTSSTLAQDSLPPYSPRAPSIIYQDDMVSLMSGHSGSINEQSSTRGIRSRSESVASDTTQTAEHPGEQWQHGPYHNENQRTRFNSSEHGDDSTVDEMTTPLSSNTPVSHTETPNTVAHQSMHEERNTTPQRQTSWLFSTISYYFGGSAKPQQTVVVDSFTESPTITEAAHDRGTSPEPFPNYEEHIFPTLEERTRHSESPRAINDDQLISSSPTATSSTIPPDLRKLSNRTSDPYKPLPDTPSEVRFHYLQLLRTLDLTHRHALHTRDLELMDLRTRLNEVDQVYRQQLRQRDFVVDDLKERLQWLEKSVEEKVENARHEVEDMWEGRWRERDRHLRERMARMEAEAEKAWKEMEKEVMAQTSKTENVDKSSPSSRDPNCDRWKWK